MNPEMATRRINTNSKMLDVLISKFEKEWRLPFHFLSRKKVYKNFLKDSDLIINGIENDVKLAQESMANLLKKAKEKQEQIKQKVIKQLQKKENVKPVGPVSEFESKLDGFISKKQYKETDIRELMKIFEDNKSAFKNLFDKERKQKLCKKLLRTYGLPFRKALGNDIFEETVQRLHNYINQL